MYHIKQFLHSIYLRVQLQVRFV